MAEVIKMPRLSDTMTEGVIAAWHKKVGDKVNKGDLLAEIETDKATMELESYKDGTVLYLAGPDGTKIMVDDLLLIVGEQGEDIAALVNGTGEQKAPPPSTEDKKEETIKPKEEASSSKVEQSQQEVVNEGRIFASPLAKKIAEDKGIDIKYIKGTGDNGRIVKSDVENYQPSTQQQVTAEKSKAPVTGITAPAGEESFEEIQVSQMRKTIARRLSESKYTAPHFYLTMSINMDNVVAARPKLNQNAKDYKISFNDIVLKAVAVALKQHPTVNSSWRGDTIRINHHVNIGVAVAVPDGLLVPVVRFADAKSLKQISAEVKEFSQKAKDKKLQPSDWEGSTFTISNLGMFGIDQFTGIINSPDACILAVGGINQEPIVKSGQIVPGNIMKVTLSCDHRVVDGASGAAFLQTLKDLLEEPLRILL